MSRRCLSKFICMAWGGSFDGGAATVCAQQHVLGLQLPLLCAHSRVGAPSLPIRSVISQNISLKSRWCVDLVGIFSFFMVPRKRYTLEPSICGISLDKLCFTNNHHLLSARCCGRTCPMYFKPYISLTGLVVLTFFSLFTCDAPVPRG